jgi:hypothetical protein
MCFFPAGSSPAVSDPCCAGFLVLGDLRDTRERERAGRSPSDSEAGAHGGAEQGRHERGRGATKPARSRAPTGRAGERHTCQQASRETGGGEQQGWRRDTAGGGGRKRGFIIPSAVASGRRTGVKRMQVNKRHAVLSENYDGTGTAHTSNGGKFFVLTLWYGVVHVHILP